MKKCRDTIMQRINNCEPFDCMNNLGDGWTDYEGCTHNLFLILQDEDSKVELLNPSNEFYKEGYDTFFITLPDWFIYQGVISISFEKDND